jgi:hypothetical protein
MLLGLGLLLSAACCLLLSNSSPEPSQGAFKKQGPKNPGKKRPTGPTDFPSFFFGWLGAMRRLWTTAVDMPPHERGHPQLAVGCGVFLYKPVPSDDPFVWCRCKTNCGYFFQRNLFLVRNEYYSYCRTK